MAVATRLRSRIIRPEEARPAHASAAAIVMLLAGMAAAWFAAGSTGLVGHALRHALTWLALSVAVVAGWPANIRAFSAWATLAGGVIFGLFFTASALTAANVLAVAVVLAAVAQVNRGLTGRLALIAAFGAMALAAFRFAQDSIPLVWLAADGIGWVLGRLAGLLAGHRLEVGATFGGLDFLVAYGNDLRGVAGLHRAAAPQSRGLGGGGNYRRATWRISSRLLTRKSCWPFCRPSFCRPLRTTRRTWESGPGATACGR